jgi:acylphosphatase
VKKLTAVISGRVQNVGYRMFARDMARRLGISGSVCNNPDGTVRVEAYGEAEALTGYVNQLERGPSAARVERIDASWSDAGPEIPAHFEVTH